MRSRQNQTRRPAGKTVRAAGRTPNPATAATVPVVTDRALRYRAQLHMPEEAVALCAYCGSTGPLDVEHVDGHEENTDPENLLFACRPCNTLKGIAFKHDGIGRQTRQYNPATRDQIGAELKRLYAKLDRIMRGASCDGPPESRGVLCEQISELEKLYRAPAKKKRFANPRRPASAGTLTEWKTAVRSLMGAGPWTPAGAVDTVQATPHSKRATFARQLARRRTTNPGAGATSSFQYMLSAQIIRGEMPGDQAKAYQLMLDTPAHKRSQWDREAWRNRKLAYGPSGRRQPVQTSFEDDNVPF